MPGTSKKTVPRKFEVLISFDGLDQGDVFSQDATDLGWAQQHVENGYLRDVTDEQPYQPEEAADVRGEVGPR
jgi:hypothetical protein